MKPFRDLLLKSRFTGGQKHFTGGPGQFIVMHELVAVMSNLLISSVFAIFRDRARQEFPTLPGFCQVGSCRLGKLLTKQGRRSALSQRGGCRSGHRGVFGKHYLWVTLVWKN